MQRQFIERAITFAALVSAVPIALFLGKDLNWDFQNYHLYAGFSAFNARWQQDFMPGSIQSYLVPYAHVPLYWMVRAGMPAIGIGAVLALLHALNVVLAVGIARTICPSPTRRRLVLTLMATAALVYLTPVYLNELGTSFIDVSSSVPIVAAVALLLRSSDASGWRTTVFAGFLLGVGAALKLTNLIFIPAAVAMCLALPRAWRVHWATLVHLGWSSLAGYLLIAGYWHYMAWSQFGNPFFPFFNALFHSPEFPLVEIRHQRFLPESLTDYLTRWFQIAMPVRDLYTETTAPDVRLAAIGILSGIMGLRLLRPPQAARSGQGHDANEIRRRLIAALVFIAAAYMFWMATSGNGRYFMPVLVIAAPVLVALIDSLFGATRAHLPVLLSVLAVQGVQTVVGADLRWNPNPWRQQWIDVRAPAALVTRPHLYLSIDMQSSSFLAPFVHPQSGFVNVGGQYAIGPGTPGFDRLQRLLMERGDGEIVLLMAAREDASDVTHPMLAPDNPLFRSVARFGLESDGRSCEVVEVGDVLGGVSQHKDRTQTPPKRSDSGSALWVCSLRRASTTFNPPKSIERVFNMIEQACPQRFAPGHQLTVPSYNTWMRTYVGSDVMLWAGNDHLWYRPWNGGEPIPLGTIDAWLSGHGQIDCAQKFIAVQH